MNTQLCRMHSHAAQTCPRCAGHRRACQGTCFPCGVLDLGSPSSAWTRSLVGSPWKDGRLCPWLTALCQVGVTPGAQTPQSPCHRSPQDPCKGQKGSCGRGCVPGCTVACGCWSDSDRLRAGIVSDDRAWPAGHLGGRHILETGSQTQRFMCCGYLSFPLSKWRRPAGDPAGS